MIKQITFDFENNLCSYEDSTGKHTPNDAVKQELTASIRAAIDDFFKELGMDESCAEPINKAGEKLTVADVIKENDADIIVKVNGRNPTDDCDCLTEEYYHGELGSIPAELHDAEVLNTGWLLGAQCYGIYIPYRKNPAGTLKS